MSDPYDFDGVQFSGDGYFVFLDYSRDPSEAKSPWEFWVATLARARIGDFSFVPLLLDVYADAEDYVLKGQCANLLASAAPASTVFRIRKSVTVKLVRGAEYDPQFAVDMSRVLFLNMKLADVPLLLSTYQDGAQFEDTEMILSYMELILGEIELAGGVSNLESDSALVSARVNQLLDVYGTDEIRLWLGKPFSITDFAKQWLLTAVPNPIAMRRIFEATTGVDCRRFFQDEEFRPLYATAVVEDFLEGSPAIQYKEGMRYFFSHRIPDENALASSH